MCFMVVALKKQAAPAIKPISRPDMGETKPLAGVIATSPATAPEIAPRTVGLPVFHHSVNIHPNAAVAVAKCVVTKALLARALDASALPPLNPNQPTHSRHAPMTERTTLC